MEKQFKLTEAAEILGIQTRTIREWIKNGMIHGKKYHPTGSWYISESELERLQKEMQER